MLTKKQIFEIVRQSQCLWKPDTIYRRIRRGMTLNEALSVSARNETARFYVYLLLDGDICFYVGSGQGDRAYRHWVKPYVDQETKVAKKVRSLLAAGIKPIIKIVNANLREKDARELEYQVMRELKPECNYYGNIKYRIWGLEFTSLDEVAKDSRCKCAYTTLKRHIHNGMPLEEAVNYWIGSGCYGQGKSVTCWGQQFNSHFAALHDSRCQVSETTVRYRMKQGMTFEEAVQERKHTRGWVDRLPC